MSDRLALLLAQFSTMPWALRLETLQAVQAVLIRRATQGRLSSEDIQAAIAGSPRAADPGRPAPATGPGAVAVIQVFGIISPRIHMVQDMCGESASAERIAQRFRAALADDSVGAIVFDIDSPGGSVFGIPELAEEIYAARSQKKIVASANSIAASAAYYIGAAAEEICVTPSGEVGSVGVYAAHEDISKALEMAGLNVTMIQYGKYKTEGASIRPLDEEARTQIQQMVDRYGRQFEADMNRYRSERLPQNFEGFGEGRAFGAKEAVKRGLADRVETLDETIARLAKSKQAQRPRSRVAAEDQLRLLEVG